MTLIVVESPTKAKTIKQILGKDYEVLASYGHIKDLPDSKKGTSIKKGDLKKNKKAKPDPHMDYRLGINTKTYEPIYVFTEKSKKIADEIKRKAKEHNLVLISTDPDREGESIAAHIAEVINDPKKVKRAAFHEITPAEIKEQIKNAGNINHNLVEAQKARRVLDRLVGYKVSPLLWKKFFMGLSAGRVQSVALRAVVEREEEIKNFVPVVWFEAYAHYKNVVFAYVQKDKDKATLKTEEDAKKFLKSIQGNAFVITSIEESKTSRSAPAPFTTSTLQQTASARLYFSPKRTMQLAQKLFEAGIITYHRTDSINLSDSFRSQAAAYIQKEYGETYAEHRVFKTKSKNAQEAHEAIRPTSLNPHAADKMGADMAKLYKLIFSRAVASQMKDAIIDKVVALAKVENTKDTFFQANFQSIAFAGFTKVYESDIGETVKNPFTQGEQFTPEKLEYKETSTKPPARYSEATLIKFLEEQGIGRPSTYATIVSTIVDRKYVEIVDKRLVPTDIGTAVTHYLKEKFKEIMDYQFTAEMEQKLDDISNGERKFYNVMKEFDEPFEKILAANLKDTAKANVLEEKTDEKCPLCGSPMEVKLGRYGKFYSCTRYPECTGIVKINTDGTTQEDEDKRVNSNAFLSMYKSAPKTDDGRDYVLKKGRFGEFWAHPDYPKVKDIKSLELKEEYIQEVFGRPPKAKDGKEMVLKKGRFGYFWAHPDYPKVKELQKAVKKKNTPATSEKTK